MNHFAPLLRELLADQHMNHRQLATKVGCSREFISQLSRGVKHAGPGVIEKIVDAMSLNETDRVRLYLSGGRIPPEMVDHALDDYQRIIELLR